jgi:DNA-binding transcriptional LysR family regulator
MPMHLRALITFGAVASEGSFSRAAQKMGVAQSWVSEQVRGLEEYLGFALLARSGHNLKLTPEGATLYTYARQMTQLRDEAGAVAAQMKAALASRLRIGSLPSTADIPIRIELIERFICLYERVQVEVVEEPVPRLMDRLEKHEYDVLLLYNRGQVSEAEFDLLKLAELRCHILIPQEDQFSRAELFPMEAFAGRTVLISPSRQDPLLIKSIEETFAPHGVNFVAAPELNRHAVERYARIKRLSVLRWQPGKGRARRLEGDMVMLPIGQEITLDFIAMRNRGVHSRNLERFWQLAARFASLPQGRPEDAKVPASHVAAKKNAN